MSGINQKKRRYSPQSNNFTNIAESTSSNFERDTLIDECVATSLNLMSEDLKLVMKKMDWLSTPRNVEELTKSLQTIPFTEDLPKMRVEYSLITTVVLSEAIAEAVDSNVNEVYAEIGKLSSFEP